MPLVKGLGTSLLRHLLRPGKQFWVATSIWRSRRTLAAMSTSLGGHCEPIARVAEWLVLQVTKSLFLRRIVPFYDRAADAWTGGDTVVVLEEKRYPYEVLSIKAFVGGMLFVHSADRC